MKIGHFFFPRICPHCQSLLEKGEGLFCKKCAFFFEALNPKFRCYYCFREDEKRLCSSCRKKRNYLIPIGAVWENFGPVGTFMHRLHQTQLPSYVKLATSFLTAQFPRLSFPKPDLIIPVPAFFLSFLWKGPNINHLIAKSLSKTLDIPMKSYLYSHSLSGHKFYLKNRADIEDKTVLLVDMHLPNVEKWEGLFEALSEGEPEKICGLTLCCQTTLIT